MAAEVLESVLNTSNMVSLLDNSMNMWRTGLTSRKNFFGEIRGIFHGDGLSPLLLHWP